MWFPRVAPQFYERPAPMSIPPKTDVTGIDGLKKPVIPSEVEGSRLDSASSDSKLPNSRKIYVAGEIHPDIRVPFREISLAQTKTMSGEIEVNEPVRVYDTSGLWGDSRFDGDVEKGLPALRSDWIRARGDVEEITGRIPTPIDDGYLSVAHAKSRNGGSELGARSWELGRKPLRAKSHPVSQLY